MDENTLKADHLQFDFLDIAPFTLLYQQDELVSKYLWTALYQCPQLTSCILVRIDLKARRHCQTYWMVVDEHWEELILSGSHFECREVHCLGQVTPEPLNVWDIGRVFSLAQEALVSGQTVCQNRCIAALDLLT